MTTAEKWFKVSQHETEYGKKTLQGMLTSHDSDWSEEDLLTAIKRIQLDAYKCGMLDAANIVGRFGVFRGYQPAVAILSEMDATTKDNMKTDQYYI